MLVWIPKICFPNPKFHSCVILGLVLNSQAEMLLDPCPVILECNLTMKAGLALSLFLQYETRASSANLVAFPASSMSAKRVLRQSFLFSSRCSNL